MYTKLLVFSANVNIKISFLKTALKSVKVSCGGHVLTRMFDLVTLSKSQMSL
jgi:hypothetical protein